METRIFSIPFRGPGIVQELEVHRDDDKLEPRTLNEERNTRMTDSLSRSARTVGVYRSPLNPSLRLAFIMEQQRRADLCSECNKRRRFV